MNSRPRTTSRSAVHLVRITSSPENDALLEALIRVPGVIVEGRETLGEYLTLREGAAYCKINYHTFREWVVVKKLIPSSRPSGSIKGDLRVKRDDVMRLLDGMKQKNKPGRKGREVTPLD